MKTIILTLVLTFLVSVSISAAGQESSRTLNEGTCRQMNENMLHTMKSTPLVTPKDIQRNRELIAVVEKMLADNRRQGVDECRSWSDVNRLIVHQ